MAEADGDPKTMQQYRQTIDAKNLNALYYIAMSREYNSVGYSNDTIRNEQLYTGVADLSVLTEDLALTMEILSYENVDWDPFVLYYLLTYEE